MDRLRQQYQQAQQDLTQLLETLNTYDPNFSLSQRVQPIQFSEIQALLDKETLLMEWYLSPQGIYTFIVRGETGEISVHLSPPEQLHQLQELRDTYLNSYSTTPTTGKPISRTSCAVCGISWNYPNSSPNFPPATAA